MMIAKESIVSFHICVRIILFVCFLIVEMFSFFFVFSFRNMNVN